MQEKWPSIIKIFFCIVLLCFGPNAVQCGVLVPDQELNLDPMRLECGALSTGLLGKFRVCIILNLGYHNVFRNMLHV